MKTIATTTGVPIDIVTTADDNEGTAERMRRVLGMKVDDLVKELQKWDATAEVLVMYQESSTGVPIIAVNAEDGTVVLMTNTPPQQPRFMTSEDVGPVV